MTIRICGLALLTCMGAAFAQTDMERFAKAEREREDQLWARKSGLSASEIRAMRMLVGFTDTTSGSVVNIDSDSLKSRNHVLLVEFHSGYCTRVHVLERAGDSFQEVWSLTEVPDRVWGVREDQNRRGICANASRGTNAHGTADGRIVVEVRVLVDPFVRSMPVDTYSFTWNGSKYELVDGER
jgi:hypothetical protein